MKSTPLKLTFEEYLHYHDDTDIRYELADGTLLAMPPASPNHLDILMFLRDIFRDEIQRMQRDWIAHPLGIGVRTGDRTSRCPDVVVVRGEDWRQLKRSGATSAILSVPALLVVEVVSPGLENRRRDYEEKLQEYQDSAMEEYWIVDPQVATVTVFSLTNSDTGKGYAIAEFRDESAIASTIFPELNLTVKEIFSV